MAWLFLFSYVFLLRVPSEALPAITDTSKRSQSQSVVWLERGKLHLSLQRRKNKPGGSLLSRGCWCEQSMRTCPVHPLGPFVEACPKGSPLFDGTSASAALAMLKFMLGEVGVKQPLLYRLHDIRRGHAKDLQLSGH